MQGVFAVTGIRVVNVCEGPTFNCVILTSGLSPEADIVPANRQVSKVPQAVISQQVT